MHLDSRFKTGYNTNFASFAFFLVNYCRGFRYDSENMGVNKIVPLTGYIGHFGHLLKFSRFFIRVLDFILAMKQLLTNGVKNGQIVSVFAHHWVGKVGGRE